MTTISRFTLQMINRFYRLCMYNASSFIYSITIINQQMKKKKKYLIIGKKKKTKFDNSVENTNVMNPLPRKSSICQENSMINNN